MQNRGPSVSPEWQALSSPSLSEPTCKWGIDKQRGSGSRAHTQFHQQREGAAKPDRKQYFPSR